MTPSARAGFVPVPVRETLEPPSPTVRRRTVALVVALLCAGCAAVPQAPESLAGDSYSGRIAVHVDATPDSLARAFSAAFELQGNADAGRLNLASPLGTLVAQARWSPDSVVLTTPQGEQGFADLDALTRKVLGESIPIAALFDWLRGQPWSGAASRATTVPPGFEQIGWAVDLARFDEALINARRERAPVVTVRVKLDRS
ncbi:MAG TPA: outer membrane lipoprotein LolB [Burkholderiaceae bacterium]|nr:outer membrane lipoprotein LolB [Burkholderiaceae bacterium]